MNKINWINGQAGNTPLSAENLNLMQSYVEDEFSSFKQLVFPIGSTYITQTNTNPSEILGFGTWERLKGKVCLGLDEGDTEFNLIGKTGGSKSHKHTTSILGGSYAMNKSGCHFVDASSQDGVASANYESTTVSNMQPYEVVGYMWIRRS